MSVVLEENSIVEGEILKIKPFGAIVELPDKRQGLVHISHISNKYVQNITDFVNIGDVVSVKILTIEDGNGKIALSIKEAGVNQEPVQNVRRSNFESGSRMSSVTEGSCFEDKLKDWIKNSNDRQAGINKRNKRK